MVGYKGEPPRKWNRAAGRKQVERSEDTEGAAIIKVDVDLDLDFEERLFQERTIPDMSVPELFLLLNM